MGPLGEKSDKVKEFYNQKPIYDLKSQFNKKLDRADHEIYLKLLYKTLVEYYFYALKMNDIIEDEKLMELEAIKLKNSNPDLLYIYMMVTDDEFKSEFYSKPKHEKLTIILMGLYEKGVFSGHINMIPKKGLFCSRRYEAREWLKGFISFTLFHPEEYNIPFEWSLSKNTVDYLITHHNEVFYGKAGENFNDGSARILKQLVLLAED